MARRVLVLALCALAAVCGVQGEDTPDVQVADVEAEMEAESEDKKVSDTFSAEERATITSTQETYQFKAEVTRLMDILINSLYSNREIFIRELVSNAADALDKVRFMSLTDESLLKADEELNIKISFDKDVRTITITDQGVGMTKTDLMNNLGVIAKSGTTDFLEASAKGGDQMSLIGQFGVGFYSVYLVADKVTVISKHTDDEQYIWESTQAQSYTVSKDPRGNTLGRGTSIVMHLKDDASEFMDETLLTKLVSRYSQFVNFPIALEVTKEVEEIAEPEEAAPVDGEDDEVVVGEEEEEEEVEDGDEVTYKKIKAWQVLNTNKPIWVKNPKDVTDEEYTDFYKALTKDTQEPLDKIHFVAEGEITFKAILYIPKTADPKVYDQYYEKGTGLKLYVRRVLISDEFDDFLPRYMNFVKGIVDSDDLPLNVSRETLAESRVLRVMAKKLTRKVLEMIRKIADRSTPEEEEEGAETTDEGPTDYDLFWAQYSRSIKMGVMDDKKNKAKLTKLLRFKSSKSNNKYTSFEEYVDRMPESQANIYFLTCQSIEGCATNPVMEKFTARDIEVLYMDEAVDEYCSQHIHEFDGIEPVNIMRESAQIPETKAFKKIAGSEEQSEFIAWLKKTLGDKVEKVFVSNKLTVSPAACTSPEYGWTGNMERIQRAQAMQQQKDIDRQVPKKIFEYNPFHPIVVEMMKLYKEDEENPKLVDMAHILFDSAAVVSGYQMMEPEDYAKRMHKVISLSLDIDPAAPMVEVETADEEEATEEETDSA